ncbi:MAG: autotransporter domain-containing protein [Parvibaculum sp.]|nr:autotransporter domain-containing protein [Parvibaculum sp.]
MARNLSLRTKLLSTSALAVAGTFWLGASPALALPPAGSCVTAGTSTITITCTGNIPYSVYTTDDNTTITLNSDAHVDTDGEVAIGVYDDNSALVMGADSTATATGDTRNAVQAHNSGDVTLNGGASITLTQYNLDQDSYALSIQGFDGSNIVLNGGSSINFIGGSYDNKYDDHQAGGIEAFGEKISITLNGESQINVTGLGDEATPSEIVENDYYGVVFQNTALTSANRNTITLNGGSSINVSRNGTDTAGSMMGILSHAVDDDKYAADITLNNSSINVSGAGASDEEKYAGIFSVGGADAHVTLNASSVTVTGESAGDDNKYAGIAVFQQNLSDTAIGGIALANGSSVTVNAYGSGGSAEVYGVSIIGMDEDFKLGHITLGGGSTVTLNTDVESSNMFGIAAKGYAPVVEMNGGSGVTLNAHGEGITSKYIGITSVDFAEYAAETGHITLNAGSYVTVQGSGASDSKYIGIMNAGYGGVDKFMGPLTLNDSFINIRGSNGEDNKYTGIMSLGGGNPITLNGASRINVGAHYDEDLEEWVGGTDAKGYVGILAFNTPGDAAPSVVLNGTSSVNITGAGEGADTKYLGIAIAGSGATVTLNGDSRVNIYVQDDSNYVTGIFSSGYSNQITLNDDARISIAASDDAFGQSVYLAGDGDTLTMNGHSMVEAYYAPYVDGVRVSGDGVTITLNDSAVIYGGFYAAGIDSVGDNTTVNVGKGTAVIGEVGILLTGNQNNLYVAGLVIGHFDAGSTTAIDVSGGTNNSVTLDSAQLIGSVLGGGSDELTLAGTGILNEGFEDFGLVTMDGDYWNLAVGSTNTADEVDIIAGRLAVNGTLTADDLTVHSGGVLGGAGTITGTVTVLAGGTVSPGNSPGTLNVVGPVTFNAGSIFEVEIGDTAADLLNATGAVTIDPGAIVQPTFFPGADGFVGDIVTGASVTGTFTPGSGAALDYSTPGSVSLTAASSSSMNGGMSAGAAQGFTFLDTVLNEAQKSASVGRTLWGTALWSKSTRTAATTSSRGFDQNSNGGAFGGDVMSAGDFTLGLAAGYLDGDAVTSGGGSRTSIEGYHAAVYSTYTFGGTYFTSAVTAAYQDQNAKRNVFSSGVLVGAQGSPEAWLGGVGFGIGHEFPLDGAFTFTPRASLGYQHMTRDGYTETGGGTGALALDEIATDTIRGRVGAELALNVADKNALWKVRPSINAALAQEWRNGDTSTTGTFRTTGAAFNGDLDSRDQTYLAVGAGVDMTVGYGVTAFVNYDGGFGGDAERSGGWRLGARMEW